MEEIIQFIVEMLLQLFWEIFADSLWRQLTEPSRIFVKALLSIAAAMGTAWLSVLVVPESLIPSEVLRIVYLILAPVVIASVMALMGRYFANRDKSKGVLEYFGFAWAFASTFALTRFLLTT